MGTKNTSIKLFEDGKRIDGRTKEEMRPVKIDIGVLSRADGSCYMEWGGNKVIAAVYGPRECHPKHAQDPLKARLTYRYNLTPFSVEDRARPGPSRRSQEISKVSREALESVVFTEYFPKTSIDVYVDILEAEAGTRCAALTAASVALADAGIPMRDLIVACAAGKAEGEVMLDLGKAEDNYGQADLPIALMPRTDEIILMQMDGDMSREELHEAITMAKKGAMTVYELQKKALKEKYAITGDTNGE